MAGIPIKGTMRPARKPIKCKKAGGRACGINVNRRYIYVNTIKKKPLGVDYGTDGRHHGDKTFRTGGELKDNSLLLPAD